MKILRNKVKIGVRYWIVFDATISSICENLRGDFLIKITNPVTAHCDIKIGIDNIGSLFSNTAPSDTTSND